MKPHIRLHYLGSDCPYPWKAKVRGIRDNYMHRSLTATPRFWDSGDVIKFIQARMNGEFSI